MTLKKEAFRHTNVIRFISLKLSSHLTATMLPHLATMLELRWCWIFVRVRETEQHKSPKRCLKMAGHIQRFHKMAWPTLRGSLSHLLSPLPPTHLSLTDTHIRTTASCDVRFYQLLESSLCVPIPPDGHAVCLIELVLAGVRPRDHSYLQDHSIT